MFCSNFTLVWCFHYFDFSFDLTTNLLYVSNLLCASSQIKHISDGSIIFIDIIWTDLLILNCLEHSQSGLPFQLPISFQTVLKMDLEHIRIFIYAFLNNRFIFSADSELVVFIRFVLRGFLFHLLCHFVRFQFSYLPGQWLCFWIICFWLQRPYE